MRKVSILLVVAGCAADVDVVSTTEQPALAANALAANAITTNALAANALAANALAANALAANALAANGLVSGAISNATVALALEDPNARIYMKYLVECALAPDQAVTFASRALGAVPLPAFEGLLGLCPAWLLGPPDQGCRERVSACLLARNNSFGYSVPFSMRGQKADPETPSPLLLSNVVPPHDRVPGTNTAVRSLDRCAAGSFAQPTERDCGWSADAVGACTPGTTVSIGAGALTTRGWEMLGTAGTSAEMLRVCASTSACDASAAIASASGKPVPLLTFACPAEGIYSVMKGFVEDVHAKRGTVGSTRITGPLCTDIVADNPALAFCRDTWTQECEQRATTACRYPATEKHVFRWKEGAFYGDMFGAENLNPAKPELRVLEHQPGMFRVESLGPTGVWKDDDGALSRNFEGVVFTSMYACSSPNWSDPVAYMRFRVCAGPGTSGLYTKNCLATYVDQCPTVCTTPDLAPPGDGDVAGCTNGSTPRRWAQPLTTFLAQPCELVPGGACGTVPRAPLPHQ